MRSLLLAAVDRNNGVIDRAHALAVVARHVIDDAVASGALVPVFQGVYCRAGNETDRDIRRRAAVLAVPGSALSHIDALAVWRLVHESVVPDGPVHVTVVASSKHPGRQRGVIVHRRRGSGCPRPLKLTTGHVVVDQYQAVVSSWRLLPDDHRRAVLIDGVRRQSLSTAALRRVLDAAPRTAGAAQMRSLIDLLDNGCQSELEIFGLTHVFDHPSLPRSVPQRRVRLRSRTVVLDRAYDDVLVAVELDGAAYHFGQRQRERDMRRDAELATLGWLVLRFSYRRIVDDPDGVRREIAQVIATRRCQLVRALGS
jgi:hypothetical protein